MSCSVLLFSAVCCSMLQCVAACFTLILSGPCPPGPEPRLKHWQMKHSEGGRGRERAKARGRKKGTEGAIDDREHARARERESVIARESESVRESARAKSERYHTLTYSESDTDVHSDAEIPGHRDIET